MDKMEQRAGFIQDISFVLGKALSPEADKLKHPFEVEQSEMRVWRTDNPVEEVKERRRIASPDRIVMKDGKRLKIPTLSTNPDGTLNFG